MIPRHLLGLSAGLLLGATSLFADTLVLEDGRRVQGQLVSASPGVVVFDAERGRSGRRQRMRVNTADVQRIVFRGGAQDDSDDPGDPFGRNDPNDQYGRNDPWGQTGRDDREIIVSANRPWTDTGINVRAGDTLHFTSDGAVIWGPGRQDTAAGEYNSPVNRSRPIPGRPAAGLIARIGSSATAVFFIGDERGPFRVNNTGRLYLGINDDYLQDNSGSFRVTVAR